MFKYTVSNNMLIPVIRGAKGGGGSSHTPVEAKESGRSHQIMEFVEVISEGEIYGLVDDMKSVYLDKTPIVNPDGTFNFKNIILKGVVGTQDQDVLAGFSSAQREVAVGTEVKKDKPITRRITDKNITNLRVTVGVKSLLQQAENGDTNPTSVDLQIRVGDRVYSHNFTGKYSAGGYAEMIEIDNLPPVPFNLTVERVTPDSTSQRLQNATVWASYTEIIDDGYAYPNTALMAMSIDSEYFQSQPQRNFLIRGLIVDVPDIYDPIRRTYSSNFWNGAFKRAWTNNPVWIWYDLVTNKRYGLGKSLAEFNVDKFQLFAIAKYCDELVPDGYGGTEPRMTCNAWITEQKQAYELIQSLSSVFRAMPIWTGQALTAVQDRASDPVWKYTNANVVEGLFTYSSSARKARHNTIQVEWVNPDDFYNSAIEQVVDDESVRKYGQNISKVTAFGCTSRGQAYRTGRWILETERLETETVSFTVGAEGLMHLPYDIIEVADNQYAGINVGGRVLSAIANKVELDRAIEFDNKTYLSYITSTGAIKRSKVLGFDKNTNTATLDQAVGDIQELAIWSLETAKVVTGLYRCISIKENADNQTFDIVALQHVPEKEDIVINGTHFDPKPRTVHTTIDGITVDYDGRKAVIRGDITQGIDNTGTDEITYDVRILKNGAVVSNKLGLKSPTYSVEDLENGDYTVIITAKDSRGRILSTREYSFTIDRPPVVANASAVGGLGCIYLTWDYVNEVTDTEIWASKTNDIHTAKLVTKLNGLMYTFECEGNETWYFWLRHVRGVNVGSFGQTTGLKATSGADLDKTLDELNKNLQENIVDKIIDVALPARNLDLIETVANLDVNVYQGHKQVYNTKDNKLYTWNGAKYLSQLTGKITADQIEANAIEAGAIKAGAIKAEHIATTQITGEKLALGLGGNLLKNPLFTNNSNGWHGFVWYSGGLENYWTAGSVGVQYENLRYNVNQAYRPHDSKYSDETFSFAKWSVADYQRLANDSKNNRLWVDNARVLANVIAGKTYIFSAYVGCHHCGGYLIAEEYSSDGRNYIRRLSDSGLFGERDRIHLNNGENCIEASSSHFANGVDTNNAHRAFVKFTAPKSGVVCLIFRISRFGYKQAYQDNYMARAMLEEVNPEQNVPSAWRETSITSIDGGSIVANSITTRQLSADSVTSNNIVTGAITARHIAVGSIGADQIATHSLTSDKLNVNALSAISSNIGTINAGSITGTNISGNNINGNNINGNNISGGTISGTTIRGVTIEASTIRGTNIEGVTVRAENIIGDVVKGYQLRVDGGRRMYYDHKYNAVGLFNSFNIPRSSRNRILILMPLLLDHITGDGEQNRPNGYIGKIRVNNVEQYCEYLVFSSRIFGGIMTSSIWLNANTDFEITCSIENTIGYNNSIYPTSKIFNFMLINA